MKKQSTAVEYLHGFSDKEQKRLYRQARICEPLVFQDLPLSNAKKLLEVGCGVGAQTEILLERFPQLHITGVDASKTQLEQARKHIRSIGKKDVVDFVEVDALNLPFSEDTFDAAFYCWFLEHVQNPIDVLAETRRVLKPGGLIICNEVMNATLYIHPYSPAILQYWFEHNDHQWNMKGDPFVGGRLANHLLHAGFQNIETKIITEHHDSRTPKSRDQYLDFWTDLLLSGAPALLKAKKISPELVQSVKKEMAALRSDPESVLFYSYVRATARAL